MHISPVSLADSQSWENRGLLAAQRTAALRRDDDLQATLLPLLLRNYLEHHLYDQADRLVSKTSFPEATAGNAQLARYYYYVGESLSRRRLHAILHLLKYPTILMMQVESELFS